MKKITLSVPDRIYAHLLLPKSGGLIKMMGVNEIIQLVRFSEQEMNDYKITNLQSGDIGYNPALSKDTDYEITDDQLNLFIEGIQIADSENRIYQDMVPLCIKIDNLTK